MATDIFTTTGTWTCPAGVTVADVECWGDSGGGEDGNGTLGGAGSGGGAYSREPTASVTPDSVYDVTVQQGGLNYAYGGPANDGLGASLSLSMVNIAYAEGGKGGLLGVGGAGGSSTNGTGTTKYSGGNGATTAVGSGGGGGSSAGTGSDGNNGSGMNGGSAPTGGSHGGDGGAFDSGERGVAPGGGSGGGGSAGLGGDGRRGEVRITYVLPGHPTMRRWGGIPGMLNAMRPSAGSGRGW